MAKRFKHPKKIVYKLISQESPAGGVAYSLLADLVEKHHTILLDARIALAWCTSWRIDADGRLTLGKCKKASDLDREFADFDFIILLNRSFWLYSLTSNDQRRALLDHELCHADVVRDKDTLEPTEDERGRKVWRIRKHDIEEFAEIVERYGCYKRDLELFATALQRSKQGELDLQTTSAGVQ